MPTGVGDNPSLLRPEVLGETARYHMESTFGNDSLMTLLPEAESILAEEVKLPELEELRKLATLKSGPAVAEPMTLLRSGTKYARAWYAMIGSEMPGNHLATVRDFDNLNLDRSSVTAAAAMSMAERWVQQKMELFGRAIGRRWKQYFCELLSSTGAFNTPVDGINQSLNFGPNSVTSTADWSVAGTDIILDMERFIEDHEDNADGPVTHIVYNPKLIARIANNTQGQEWRKRIQAQSAVGSPASRRWPVSQYADQNGWTSIEVREKYDLSGTQTDMYPQSFMTLITAAPDTFYHMTVMTEDNEYQGGAGADSWRERNPKRQMVISNDNRGFGIHKSTNVTVCNLQIP